MTRRPVVDERSEQAIRADPRFQEALAALTPPLEWRAAGRCTGVDPELFFPHPAEDPGEALGICNGCRVLGPCLATALRLPEAEGVWGGTTGSERRLMRVVWNRMALA